MNERECNELREQLLQEAGITDENREIFERVLKCCLKEDDDSGHLVIKLKGDKGILKRNCINFNLIVAIQLLNLLIDMNGSVLSMKNGISFVLQIVGILSGQNEKNLDDMQVIIIHVLYQIRENKERNISEDDLYERIQKEMNDKVINKNEFHNALSKLYELKCIKIYEGTVELEEKVRY